MTQYAIKIILEGDIFFTHDIKCNGKYWITYHKGDRLYNDYQYDKLQYNYIPRVQYIRLPDIVENNNYGISNITLYDDMQLCILAKDIIIHNICYNITKHFNIIAVVDIIESNMIIDDIYNKNIAYF